MMLMSDPKPNDAFVWAQEPWGRALRCLELPAPHVFTTRDVILRSDQREWRLVAESLGVAPDRLFLIKQVHGTGVAVARRGSPARWTSPEADIIISDDPSVAIGVRVADCAPVLLVDPVRNVVGAAHAGWRGTAAGVSARAVDAMRETFGTDPADLIVAVGPSLGPCCAEVGAEVREAFRNRGADEPSLDRWFRPGSAGRPYLDLWQANRDQLEERGVHPARIHAAELCTKTHADRFHSYRAVGSAAGRMLGAVRAL
jgi:YfiH family protein